METIKRIVAIASMTPMVSPKVKDRRKGRPTTVSLHKETYDRLNKFRHGGETWEQFLNRITELLETKG